MESGLGSIFATDRRLLSLAVVFTVLTAFPAGARLYQVGSGDVLSVKVAGEENFTGSYRVMTNGSIKFGALREVPVAGKTTEELEKLFTERLKDGYLWDPQVTVEVKEYHSQEVMVLGAVGRPGTYGLTEETRILDLISRAGGVSPSGGKNIVIVRRGPDAPEPPAGTKEVKEEKDPAAEKKGQVEMIVVDYASLTQKGDFSQNVLVKNGDIINVPRANEVLISGNVGRPGPMKFEEGMMLFQAVMLAGDTTVNASPKNTYVLRKGDKGYEKTVVRLDRIKEGKEKDFPLKADDVVVVPESFF